MTITAIILSHYKEREGNLKRIVDDLLVGTVKPDKIIIFIDDPEIEYEDDRCTIIKSSKPFFPNIRFALGSIANTDYCFFIDDDLTVRKKTLENFTYYGHCNTILGLEGNILASGDSPYTDGKSIDRSDSYNYTDIVIRTYFVPRESLLWGIQLQIKYPYLPNKCLDDIYLCLGNIYLNGGTNYIIPVGEETDITELQEGGVGQSYDGEHYKNRNYVCKFITDKYRK